MGAARPTPLETARGCAARGWPVFPCKADKTPLTEHGFKDASTDTATLTDWWAQYPYASVGIATGEAHLVVIDVDVKRGAPGRQNFDALANDIGPELKDTAVTRTQSGGWHFYYRANGYHVTSRAGKLAEAVDIRAEGGYVIAYPWVKEHGPERLRDLPAPLAERLATLEKTGPAEPVAEVIHAGEGRWDALTSLAGTMRRRGMQEPEMAAALLEFNRRRCVPPYPESKVRGLAKSAEESWQPKAVLVDEGGPRDGQAETPESPATPRFRWYTSAELSALDLAVPRPVVAGLLYLRQATVLIGQIKLSGKTTLALDVARCILRGDEWCGNETLWMPVYYLSEQSPASFIPQAERAGLLALSDFHILFHEDTGNASWEDAGEDAVRATELWGPGLIIADTWGKWARFEGESENFSGAALAAMRVIERWKAAGSTVFVSAHSRKQGGSLAEVLRGSTAAGGDFDVLADLRPDTQVDRRRVLRRAGRPFVETPPNLAVYLNHDHRYASEGLVDEVRREEKIGRLENAIYRALSAKPEGLTYPEVDEILHADGFGHNAVQDALRKLAENEEKPVARGRATVREPFRYFMRDPEEDPL